MLSVSLNYQHVKNQLVKFANEKPGSFLKISVYDVFIYDGTPFMLLSQKYSTRIRNFLRIRNKNKDHTFSVTVKDRYFLIYKLDKNCPRTVIQKQIDNRKYKSIRQYRYDNRKTTGNPRT